MAKQQLTFETTVKVIVEVDPETQELPTLVESRVKPKIPKELEESMYWHPDGKPKADGTKCMMNNLIQGVVNLIKTNEVEGYKKNGQQISEVIEEIKRGVFYAPTESGFGEF